MILAHNKLNIRANKPYTQLIRQCEELGVPGSIVRVSDWLVRVSQMITSVNNGVTYPNLFKEVTQSLVEQRFLLNYCFMYHIVFNTYAESTTVYFLSIVVCICM